MGYQLLFCISMTYVLLGHDKGYIVKITNKKNKLAIIARSISVTIVPFFGVSLCYICHAHHNFTNNNSHSRTDRFTLLAIKHDVIDQMAINLLLGSNHSNGNNKNLFVCLVGWLVS